LCNNCHDFHCSRFLLDPDFCSHREE
jgi:hypothetical protein